MSQTDFISVTLTRSLSRLAPTVVGGLITPFLLIVGFFGTEPVTTLWESPMSMMMVGAVVLRHVVDQGFE